LRAGGRRLSYKAEHVALAQQLREAGDSYRPVAKQLGLSLVKPQRVLAEPTPTQLRCTERERPSYFIHQDFGLFRMRRAQGLSSFTKQ
jgi:hypothetical protein